VYKMSLKAFYEDETLYSTREHRWKQQYVNEVLYSTRAGLSGLTEYIRNMVNTNKLTEKEVFDILSFMIHIYITNRSCELSSQLLDMNKTVSHIIFHMCKPFPFHTTKVSMSIVKFRAMKYRRIQNLIGLAYSFSQYDIMSNFLKFGYEPNYDVYKKILWNKDSEYMEMILTYSPLSGSECQSLWKDIKKEVDEYRQNYDSQVDMLRTCSILKFAKGYLL